MSLDLRRITYLSGHSQLRDCPLDQGVEVAFAGRSNVGKSSLINALCERRGIARTSSDPGRTRLLHFFEVEEGKRLVDLPGYGFAKVSRNERAGWQKMVEGYLTHRQSLVRLMLIMDIRRPLRDSDQMLLKWCANQNLPIHLLLNKSDKLSRNKALQAQRTVQEECGATADLVSARTKAGLENVRNCLCSYLEARVQGPKL